ncbi:MAG: imidazole glycerol phosphate synthase subunit HisH [Microcystis sp. M046S1]|jgi:glutamine amidotransferase|uniref:imidazole glycerol phosphate synthase subunit HisH n=1 Tax=Microcystis sp. M046S1 TaxID=2771118 RepID=UPI00258A2097|nr:imidazole glycerol phosphate synthase subunit HisH [Microcystis sp. M046S1]MCA2882672.1 imidazole glycerol phosphate synthase subunit HisH [Microcystis sp. M046S1]
MFNVGLIDYHAGNIRSIVTAFEHLGAKTQVVQKYIDTSQLTHLVLPGVGAFNFCFERLKVSGMLTMIEEWTFVNRKPILGICVGMQLLAESSDEMGIHSGLGWMEGKVQKLHSNDPSIRIPHVGWNTVAFHQDFGEYPRNTQRDFYFDHSHAYYSSNKDQVLATANHGQTFCAAIRQENLVAVQFHPEKSQASGIKFLQSFLSM